jgi:hypothetical protein
MADEDTNIDDGRSDERRQRRRKAVKALWQSLRDHVPEVSEHSERSGAEIDTEIAALQQRVSALEATDVQTDKRLDALEAGGPTTPPVEPPIEPPIEPPVTGKRYPTKNDPSVGLPAGTSLQTQGATTLSQAGAKVSGKKFTGRVTIAADNVELFNCTIDTTDWWAIMVNGRNAHIHHCTISSSATNGNSGVNTGNGMNLHHCRFTGFENGFNVAGDDNTIEWNEVWQLKGNSSSHYDALQADGGVARLKIRHNLFEVSYGQTAATMIDNWAGKIDDVLIEDNWLGGGGYPCYIDGSFKGASNATNIRYLKNVIKPGQWGVWYWRDAGSGCRHEGNTHYQTGASVD